MRLHPKASNQQHMHSKNAGQEDCRSRTTHDVLTQPGLSPSSTHFSTRSLAWSRGASATDGRVRAQERGRVGGRSMLRSRAGNGMMPLLLTVLCAGCGALVQPNQPGIPAAGLRLPLRTGVPSSHVLSTKVAASVRLLRMLVCLDGRNCKCVCVYCIHTK